MQAAPAPDLVERWAARLARLPLVRPRQPEPLPVRIDRGRVYILPTGFGLFLGAMLLLAVASGLSPQISSCSCLENIASWWLWVHSRLKAQAVPPQAPARATMHSVNSGREISMPP